MVFQMENEATLEKIGDSQNNGGAAEEVVARDEHETTTEAAVECSNGVCVLNWKPNRSAA
jgi:hypothetical protein